MRIEEAKWIIDQINKLNISNVRLLDIGGSTQNFRNDRQPFINDIIFTSLVKLNIEVVHSDIKNAEGVDFAGDILNKEFREVIKKMSFPIILASNLLEHVRNLHAFCEALEYILPAQGILIITVPNLYPYHRDPIDTLFRPDVKEVVSLFPGCDLKTGTILESSESHIKTLLKNPYNLLLTLKNWMIPRYGFREWKKRCNDIPNIFKCYKMTCVVFQKR